MSDIVQIWQIPLEVSESALNQYFICLSPDEKSRANRFKFADDRRRYVVARGVLRHLLGREMGRSPHQITFTYGQYGKPALDGIHFNLSHSGELALCVLGYQRKVGIDIERLKPIKRLDGMMERCLSTAELAQIQSIPVSEQLESFLQRWTCKEAYLKAIGSGLTQSMQTVEVQLCPPQLVCVPHDCPQGWHLDIVSLPESYVGALVTAGQAKTEICHWAHSPADENDS